MYLDNIRSLLANIKFISTSFRNRSKCEVYRAFLACFVASTNQLYICRQGMYVVFILQFKYFRNYLNKAEKKTCFLTMKSGDEIMAPIKLAL